MSFCSVVAFTASICPYYIFGNYGHARSQGGRQPAAAKPPVYNIGICNERCASVTAVSERTIYEYQMHDIGLSMVPMHRYQFGGGTKKCCNGTGGCYEVRFAHTNHGHTYIFTKTDNNDNADPYYNVLFYKHTQIDY